MSMKKLVAMVLAMVLFVSTALAWGEKDTGDKYTDAVKQLQAGDYSAAAAAFAELGNYQDASQMAMYCYAVSCGEKGNYSLAVTNLQSLGAFRDSALLATYYCALSYEAAEKYEKAWELFTGLELYKDVASRLETYPEKINARDYALADAAEAAGELKTALKGFTGLGAYKDSAARAAAVQEKIWAADYEAADAAEQNGELETALAGFTALGNYKDSADRAAAVQKKLDDLAAEAAEAARAAAYEAADKAEKDGDYAAAYDGFVALGDYKDSADRAAAVQVRASYAKGMDAIKRGKYTDAYDIFAGLGDYEDSQAKAYALGISDFASLSTVVEGVVIFSFHGKYGLVNLNENITIAPQWEYIGTFVDGLAVARKNNLYGVVNLKGEVISDYQWAGVAGYMNGRTVVAKKDTVNSTRYSTYHLYALMDDQGQVLGNWWTKLGSCYTSWDSPNMKSPVFAEDRIMVYDGSKYGFIDSQGKTMVQPVYDNVYSYANSLAAVQKNGMWGFIDLEGNTVIPFQYSEVTSFNANGLADVCRNGEWQIIDKEGNLVYFKSGVEEAAEEPAKETAAESDDPLLGVWKIEKLNSVYGEACNLLEWGFDISLELLPSGEAIWTSWEETLGASWVQGEAGLVLHGNPPASMMDLGFYAPENGRMQLELVDGQLIIYGSGCQLTAVR